MTTRERTTPLFDAIRLGNQLYLHRHARRWSRRDLAETSGVSASTIQRVETGQLPGVSLDTLCRLAAALDIPTGRIIKDLEKTE